MPSVYSMMLSVPGSRTRWSRISPKPMSTALPVEMTAENPTWRMRAQSRIAAQRAPDCETSASRPGNGLPVTGEDLGRAIDAVLARGAVTGEQRPSLGCNIKWRDSSMDGNVPAYPPFTPA